MVRERPWQARELRCVVRARLGIGCTKAQLTTAREFHLAQSLAARRSSMKIDSVLGDIGGYAQEPATDFEEI